MGVQKRNPPKTPKKIFIRSPLHLKGGNMTQQMNELGTGDWIMHRQFSLGQIKQIEVKEIGGEASEYYRVESENSIFWIPIDKLDSEFIRPLATEEEIQEALAELAKPSPGMDRNYKKRQKPDQKGAPAQPTAPHCPPHSGFTRETAQEKRLKPDGTESVAQHDRSFGSGMGVGEKDPPGKSAGTAGTAAGLSQPAQIVFIKTGKMHMHTHKSRKIYV
jgi:hypothetical protein